MPDPSTEYPSSPAAGDVVLPAAGESVVLCGVTISAVEVKGTGPFYVISKGPTGEGDHRA
jgi:hypothetical protein